MKLTFHKPKLSKILAISLSLIILAFMLITHSAFGMLNQIANLRTDSTLIKPKAREILLSQHLFITEIKVVKKGNKSNKLAFKAKLKDSFKVIRYDVDSSKTEIDWVMCDAYGKPKMGIYLEGTQEYNALDTLVTRVKAKLKKSKIN